MDSGKINKKCIAFVSIRYGMEVNGGAEFYCRQLAEKLKDYYDVEVLTTCAIDYVTWKDEYKEGTEVINDVIVRRFKVDHERNSTKFNNFTPKVLEPQHTIDDEIKWMEMQGPVSNRLLDYLSDNKNRYSAIIFIPYLYYTTYFGMKIAPEKSFLISAAHDEPYIKLKIFKEMFKMPKGIIFLTDEEKNLVHSIFLNNTVPYIVLGSGIDISQDIVPERFSKKYNIYNEIMLYLGRIDESKGCKELFDYFIRYKEMNKNNGLKLVLIGKAVMQLPKHPDIVSIGFVSDNDKFDGIALSKIVILPSKYESLSISVLESMKVGKPVLVNGYSKVLKEHCKRSNAGLYYNNYDEFSLCLTLLHENRKLRGIMGANGIKYINQYYTWNMVLRKLSSFL